MPAVHGEARAFGLGDFDGFQVLSKIVDEVLGIVAIVRRKGYDTVVDNSQYLHLVEVHYGHYAFDRASVAVVLRTGPEPAKGVGQPHPILALYPVISR